MKISFVKEDRYVIITPEEENLSASVAPALKTELVILSNEGFHNIICNLDKTAYVDSSGLSAFLIGDRLCNEKNGKFVLCNSSNSLDKLLKLSQLDSILNITPSVSEAIDFVMLSELERDLRD